MKGKRNKARIRVIYGESKGYSTPFKEAHKKNEKNAMTLAPCRWMAWIRNVVQQVLVSTSVASIFYKLLVAINSNETSFCNFQPSKKSTDSIVLQEYMSDL